MKKLFNILLISFGIVMMNFAVVIETPMPDQTHKILELDPVIIKFDPNGVPHYALDANSVIAVYPELVGSGNTINYAAFIPILIEQIQKLQQQNNQN